MIIFDMHEYAWGFCIFRKEPCGHFCSLKLYLWDPPTATRRHPLPLGKAFGDELLALEHC